MRPIYLITILTVMCYIHACQAPDKGRAIFDKSNLVAWCIVPFDAADRSAEERAAMLKELGIKKMAYDYRDRHIPFFAHELEVMKEAGIEVSAVWLWVDMREGKVIGEASRKILDIMKESGLRTEIWLGFSEDLFMHDDDQANIEEAAGYIEVALQEAEAIGCSLALYNHGGWFGEPENLVKIVERLDSGKVKIVYNFHHGHGQIDRFPELLEIMMPHLSTINLNGMIPGGPKIVDIGKGSAEQDMMQAMLDAGYQGPVGILGHTEGEDIKNVLERNLEGLESLRLILK